MVDFGLFSRLALLQVDFVYSTNPGVEYLKNLSSGFLWVDRFCFEIRNQFLDLSFWTFFGVFIGRPGSVGGEIE